VSFLLSWLVFGWMIARLPRDPVNFASAIRAALLAAIGFELFKLVGSIYLKSVLHSPAGATFGPVLGLMVFAYVTARLLLFATAWAATTNPSPAPAVPTPTLLPEPVAIPPTVPPADGLKARQAVAAFAVGLIGAIGLSRLVRRDKEE
jgi:membrane protein